MHVPGYEYRRQRLKSSGKGGFGWHQGEADAMDGHQYGCFHARHPLSSQTTGASEPDAGKSIYTGRRDEPALDTSMSLLVVPRVRSLARCGDSCPIPCRRGSRDSASSDAGHGRPLLSLAGRNLAVTAHLRYVVGLGRRPGDVNQLVVRRSEKRIYEVDPRHGFARKATLQGHRFRARGSGANCPAASGPIHGDGDGGDTCTGRSL